MAGNLFPPAENNIPVNQVAIETYELVWRLRRRIAYWSIVPFFLCLCFWIVADSLYYSDLVKEYNILGFVLPLLITILEVLVTVPFQVAIHRLAYPGFDFDKGRHGPPLRVVNKHYFLCSIKIVVLPLVILEIIKIISYNGNFYYMYLFSILFYACFVFSFILIFPISALGVKPGLFGAWWLLRGNFWRLVLCVCLTAGPAYLLTLIHFLLPDQSGTYASISDAVFGAMYIVLNLLMLALWACCVSLCYYHVTNRQPLTNEPTD